MRREDHDRLAAEHVLGLLDGEEAVQAERLIESDRAFAAQVEGWRARFAELDETARPESPSVALWDKIATSTADAPVRLPSRAATPARESWFARLWNDLGFWRGAGLASAAAALLLTVGLGYFMQAAARKPVMVAVMLTDANEPAGIVNILADGRAELLPLRGIEVPAGRVLEIWTLWDRARGPVSLGTLASARTVPLRLDHLPRTSPDQLFEITLEPAGGSPTGRPTGPILMKGTASTAL
ncbi:MAG: hypothetical protein JWL93_1418 [Hyphomicrobiales bacterium]|nr:hypothetical protein [Hyphomicrobiales bacterium]